MLITKLVAIFVESNEKEFLVQVLKSQMKNERAFIEFLSLKPSVRLSQILFF